MKIFYFAVGSNQTTAIRAKGDTLDKIMSQIHEFEQMLVNDVIDYWEQFHDDCTQMIDFLKTSDIINCGSIESIEMDIFIIR